MVTWKEKEETVNQFFKDAFCAKSVKIYIPSELKFEVSGIVEIIKDDGSAPVYLASLENVEKLKVIKI